MGGKFLKLKKVVAKKEEFFSKSNEEKNNGHNWKDFEVDTLIARREKCQFFWECQKEKYIFEFSLIMQKIYYYN